MVALIVIALFAAALKAALAALEAWSLRRIEANEVLSPDDVEEIIEDALMCVRGGKWPRQDWYRFIHARFRDPQLESIRRRCAKYGDHFLRELREGEYQGMETVLEPILEELRALAGPGVRQPRSRPDPVEDTFEEGYSRSHDNGVILWVAERQMWRGTRWYIAVSRTYTVEMMAVTSLTNVPRRSMGRGPTPTTLAAAPSPARVLGGIILSATCG